MRAVTLEQYKMPWTLKEMPDPEPGPGQVVIAIEACGLCGTDVHIHEGHMPFIRPPVVLGHEPVGKIAAVGAGVTALRVGDRVGVGWVQRGCGRCDACQRQKPWYCMKSVTWISTGGGHADYMVAWAEGCVLIPEGVDPVDAAPIFCAGYTVMSSLRAGRPQAGERVAVLGIGGLGHLGVQISKALGFETVAITSSESKRAEAVAQGADHVVIAGDDVGASLMAIGGADVIVATTNSAAHVTQALGGLRPDGRLVNAGAVDGPIQVSPLVLMFPARQLIGGSQFERRDVVDALALVAAGKVKPRVERYKLDEINDVRDRLAAGKVRYRAVLTPR